MVNLVTNACDAMKSLKDQGFTRQPELDIEVERIGEEVGINIRDNGVGIPPNLREHVFVPFFTTKRETGGTGLGLSVSLGIAEAHGGSLTAASEPHGATFTVRLPIAERDA